MCEYNQYYNNHFCNVFLNYILLSNIIICSVFLLITLIFLLYKIYFKKWKYNDILGFYEFALVTYTIIIPIRLIFLILIYKYKISSYIVFLDEIWWIFILIAKNQGLNYCIHIIDIIDDIKSIKTIKKIITINIFIYIFISILTILITNLIYKEDIKITYILLGIRKITFCLISILISLCMYTNLNKTYKIYNSFTKLNNKIDKDMIINFQNRKKRIVTYFLMLFYFTILTLILFVVYLFIESLIMIIDYKIFLNKTNIIIWYSYYYTISIFTSIFIVLIYCFISLIKE